ncbi:MAG: hypothetical protein GX488_07475, partial [Clostridiales bacterium]|nr:hypothetical protein [Clostridiales bacterium]
INYFAPTNINEYFTDVKNEECGANELYDLATCGVIGSTGLFRPSESLTREDMIRYAVNAFFCCVSPDYAAADTEKKSFADDSVIGTDFKEYIRCAAILGLINGRSGNLLELSDKATRAEAVTVAGRLADMKAQIDSSVYVKASAKQSDGELVLSFSLANNTEKPVVLTSTNSQTFDFVIFDKDGKQIYRWSDDKVFSTVITKTKIEPGKEAFFSDKIDTKTYSSIKDRIFCIKAYPVGTSSDFSINPNGYIVFDTNLD